MRSSRWQRASSLLTQAHSRSFSSICDDVGLSRLLVRDPGLDHLVDHRRGPAVGARDPPCLPARGRRQPGGDRLCVGDGLVTAYQREPGGLDDVLGLVLVQAVRPNDVPQHRRETTNQVVERSGGESPPSRQRRKCRRPVPRQRWSHRMHRVRAGRPRVDLSSRSRPGHSHRPGVRTGRFDTPWCRCSHRSDSNTRCDHLLTIGRRSVTDGDRGVPSRHERRKPAREVGPGRRRARSTRDP